MVIAILLVFILSMLYIYIGSILYRLSKDTKKQLLIMLGYLAISTLLAVTTLFFITEIF